MITTLILKLNELTNHLPTRAPTPTRLKISTHNLVQKSAEKILRHMFKYGTINGDDSPIKFWRMQWHFTDTHARGSSSWRNIYNLINL